MPTKWASRVSSFSSAVRKSRQLLERDLAVLIHAFDVPDAQSEGNKNREIRA